MKIIPSFSQKKGLKPIAKLIQLDGIDQELRAGLWSAIYEYYLSCFNFDTHPSRSVEIGRRDAILLFMALWKYYFKFAIDTLGDCDKTIAYLRGTFFGCEWNEVYDFIQFVANNYPASYPNESRNVDFMEYCNHILEIENSAYRFVGGEILQMTSEEEISEVEQALDNDLMRPVTEHIKTALKLMSDRKSPDYRNSIKESISAVESICGKIANRPNSSLGDALDIIKRQGKIEFHPALENALDKLYGYTSNENGIRHALQDMPNLYYEDAKFMLVACSTFINYLIAKLSRGKIEI